MLRLTRNVPKRVSVPLTRGLAEVVPAKRTPSISVTRKSKATRILEQGRVPVKEDHGLWAFFRRKQGDDLVGEARYETIEHPVTVEQHMSGPCSVITFSTSMLSSIL
jgi:large subunit ribosomal protein L47